MITQITIDTALVDKIKDYCGITSIQVLQLEKGNGVSKYIAEEATSAVLMAFHKLNMRNGFTEDKQTDNFIFISCKNHVINTVHKQEALKRSSFKDYNNLPLDNEVLDNDYVYELSGDDDSYIEYNDYIEEKLNFIVDVLRGSEFIRDIDIELFFWYFVDGKTLKDFAKEKGIEKKRCTNIKKRIINVIQHLYNNK